MESGIVLSLRDRLSVHALQRTGQAYHRNLIIRTRTIISPRLVRHGLLCQRLEIM